MEFVGFGTCKMKLYLWLVTASHLRSGNNLGPGHRLGRPMQMPIGIGCLDAYLFHDLSFAFATSDSFGDFAVFE